MPILIKPKSKDLYILPKTEWSYCNTDHASITAKLYHVTVINAPLVDGFGVLEHAKRRVIPGKIVPHQYMEDEESQRAKVLA